MLVVVLMLFLNAWDGTSHRVVFYYISKAAPALACKILPLSILVTLIYIVYALRRKSPANLRGRVALGFMLLVVANVFACGATARFIFNSTTQLDAVYLKNHAYRLDTTFIVGVGDNHRWVLAVWDCDITGWFCRVIYDQELYPQDPYAQELDADISSKLTIDANNETVVLLVNDQVVFSYKP
jgi:hypothetical protein